MAEPFDFTGKNIEDTYQRVVQTDGTNFYDGTGSAVSIGGSQNLQQVTDQGSATTTPITASIISASGQFLGSNFGLDSTDKLEFSNATLQFRLNDGSRITHTPTIFRPTSDEGVSLGRLNEKWKELVVNNITASGDISASGTIHANLSSGTSNYIVVYDDGELKTDFVDSDIFNQNLVTYVANLGPPQTPASDQVAIWTQAGELKGVSGATIDRDGVITATALTASLDINNQSFIGYLNVGKLSIAGKVVGDHDGSNTKIGNSNDTSTTIQSPKLVATNLKFTGDLEGSVDGGTF